jgi:cyclopropane-fatty-acyl-phospholipid synthase
MGPREDAVPERTDIFWRRRLMNKLLNGFLKRTIRKGNIEIVDSAGKLHTYGDGTLTPVRIRFNRASAERNVILNPGLKLGEEFMEGGFDFEAGSIYDFMETIFLNTGGGDPTPLMKIGAQLRFATRRVRQINTTRRSKRNVAHHYDLDGRLYELFLDSDRQYSCAYFEDGDTDLEGAQLAKKRHLAAKLRLQPGMKVLDIGSGWGGLGLYLADRCGVDVTGVTLSEEQHAVSNQRAKDRGLAATPRGRSTRSSRSACSSMSA